MGSILINSTFIARPKLKFTAKNLNANITGELSGKCVAGGKALPVKAFKTVSLIKNGRVDDYTTQLPESSPVILALRFLAVNFSLGLAMKVLLIRMEPI